MLDLVLNLIENLYIELFVLSFLASTLIPFGSEGFLVYLITKEDNVLLLIAIASAGNYLGSATNYYIGTKGSKTIFSRIIKFDEKEIISAKEKFTKYGSVILFFSWVPIIGDPLTFAAGLMKYNFKKFTIYVLLGKITRYTVVSLVALKFLE